MLFRMSTLAVLLIGLMLPDVASAQWRGSRGRGWDGSWDGRRGDWNNGYYGGYSYYPFGSYGWSGSTWYPGSSYGSAYFDPSAVDSTRYQDGRIAINPNRARVVVILPDPNTEVLIQGQRMELMGRSRIFISPDLEPGKEYTYTITMRRGSSGRNEDEIRKVDVRAGISVTVDFSRPAMQQIPLPGSVQYSPLPK